MNTQIKTVLAFGAIIFLLIVLYYQYTPTIKNEGEVEIDKEPVEMDDSTLENDEGYDSYIPESTYLSEKFENRNSAKYGPKVSSYSGALRGNTPKSDSNMGPSEFDSYFDETNNVISNCQNGVNDQFLPNVEGNTLSNVAAFKSTGQASCGSNQDCSPEELYDLKNVLPNDYNPDWFEVLDEPISVKNRHLIPVIKNTGVNTIGSSNKNSSYDLRGTVPCPKTVVSPWMQSSIEPDTNLRGYLG